MKSYIQKICDFTFGFWLFFIFFDQINALQGSGHQIGEDCLFWNLSNSFLKCVAGFDKFCKIPFLYFVSAT